MKKQQAESLAARHQKYYAGRHEKLHVIPQYPDKTGDSHCILCSSESNEPLHVFTSERDMNSTIAYQKKRSSTKWW